MAKTIGEFRHRVTIQQKVASIDHRGFPVESWETVCDVWASVENLRGREYFAAAAVQAEQTVRFTLRHRPGIDTKMRILHVGREYQITHVDHVKHARKYLEILTMEVVRSAQ